MNETPSAATAPDCACCAVAGVVRPATMLAVVADHDNEAFDEDGYLVAVPTAYEPACFECADACYDDDQEFLAIM